MREREREREKEEEEDGRAREGRTLRSDFTVEVRLD